VFVGGRVGGTNDLEDLTSHLAEAFGVARQFVNSPRQGSGGGVAAGSRVNLASSWRKV
jgi:hypothetical protein